MIHVGHAYYIDGLSASIKIVESHPSHADAGDLKPFVRAGTAGSSAQHGPGYEQRCRGSRSQERAARNLFSFLF